MHYQTFALKDQFTLTGVRGEGDFRLSDNHRALVDEVWNAKKLLHDGLYNGKVLSFVSYNGVQMIGEWIEYKYFVAQMERPELKSELSVQPICLSGITCCEGAVLIGKRSKSVYQYPGYFETVPSGGLESRKFKTGVINIQKEAMRELEEETGISKCLDIELFALTLDSKDNMWEVCVTINVSKKAADNMYPKTAEYEMLQWVPKNDLSSAMKKGSWVPLSKHLCQLYQNPSLIKEH